MEGMIVTQLSPAKTSVAGVFATKISTTNNISTFIEELEPCRTT